MELKDKILKAKSFDALVSVVEGIEGIKGSHKFYHSAYLVKLIRMHEKSLIPPRYITRRENLRRKVMMLVGHSEELIESLCKEDDND